MDEKIIVFDLNSKNTFNEINNLIQANNLFVPGIKVLQKWASIDYTLSNSEFETFKILSKHKITLYHGCKSFDINKYYNKGILILDKNELFELFSEYIKHININFSDTHIAAFKHFLNNRSIPNAIYCLLTPKAFEKECSSYVTFGSEFIAGFIINQFQRKAYEELIKIGQPTIIKINTPIKNLNFYNQKVVCKELLTCYNSFFKREKFNSNCAIKIENSVHPNDILSHKYLNEYYLGHLNRNIKNK